MLVRNCNSCEGCPHLEQTPDAKREGRVYLQPCFCRFYRLPLTIQYGAQLVIRRLKACREEYLLERSK